MRSWLILVALSACGGPFAGDACPIVTEDNGYYGDGEPCSFSGECYFPNDFSSCESVYCRCVDGTAKCRSAFPAVGAACEDVPSCSQEGNPGCMSLPTSEDCYCDDQGTWRCRCSCYGARTTCSVDPCDVPPDMLAGAFCSDVGSMCSYPTATCECVENSDPTAQAIYRCQ